MRTEKIRDILLRFGRLTVEPGALADTTDLFEVGLTSLTTVQVMLALEDAFDVEFPQNMLSRRHFQSIDTIDASLAEILGE